MRTADSKDTLTRIHVYRYILACVENKDEHNLLFDLAILKYHHLICSPRVSIAINSYLDSRYAPSALLGSMTIKNMQEGKYWEKFFELAGEFVKQNIKYHRDVPEKLDAVIDAMCWELETTRDTFLGSDDSNTQKL